jgi:hypothetical protein
MKATRQKLAPFKLSVLTCRQLYDILTKEPEGRERKQLKDIRGWFKCRPGKLEMLQLCGSLKASHYKAHMITAENLCSVPEIKLMIGGGHPKAVDMPRWSSTLKSIAMENGITIHRWGKGAFRLKKKEPTS